MAVVAGGPRLGDLEAGAVATAFGDTFAVVSGGVACIAGALVVARLLPAFRHQETDGGRAGSPVALRAAADAAAAEADGTADALLGPADAVEAGGAVEQP